MIYFLKDNATPQTDPKNKRYNFNWHAAGGAIHLWMGITVAMLWGVHWGILMIAITWYFFDGAVNSWYLHREWFFIGTTAQIDVAQRKVAAWIDVDPRTLSAILKTILLTGAVVNMFLSHYNR